MAHLAVVGDTQATEGKEAGRLAAHAAQIQLGRSAARFGIVIYAQNYDPKEVLHGVSSILGETPVWGFSTSTPFTREGQKRRSVVVALLAGEDLKAQADWSAGFSLAPHKNAAKAASGEILLVAGDGLSAEYPGHMASLSGCVAGCLAYGSKLEGQTSQIGGAQAGPNGTAIASLGGKLAISTGAAHGWVPTGVSLKVDGANRGWIQKINGQTPVDVYSQVYGYAPEAWTSPPMDELARLYPLGLTQTNKQELLPLNPLWLEANGTLRTNIEAQEGQNGYFMNSNQELCLEAARQATRQALDGLGNARPIFGLVFIDKAWESIFVSKPGQEILAIQELTSIGLPLAGGYTYGQIASPDQHTPPQLLNGHITVVLFGETASGR